MERNSHVINPLKSKRRKFKESFRWVVTLLKFILFITGLKNRGIRNAKDLQLTQVTHTFSDLPSSFDGFNILHLSDLHSCNRSDIVEMIKKTLKENLNTDVDLCVFTGDYGNYDNYIYEKKYPTHKNSKDEFQKQFKDLIETITSKHGFVAIMGNHDSCLLVSPLEKLGIKVLINENLKIEKNGETLQVIGVDDVHLFYTPKSLAALDVANEHFTIGLVHSAELFDYAQERGVDLYLSGHSHGGQIRFPGGFALFRRHYRGRKFYRGLWQYKNMIGYTSSGIGTSGLPVRFNAPPEIILHTLKRDSL